MFFKDYPDILSIKQVQEILGIGKTKTYELLRNNAIPNVRIGKKYIISKLALLKFLNPYDTNEVSHS